MPFIPDRFDVGRLRHLAGGRPLRGTPAGLPLVTLVIVSALIAGLRTGAPPIEKSPSIQISSEPQPHGANAGPSDIVEAILTARRMNDEAAAASLFANDASIVDSAGAKTTGAHAALRLIESLSGLEAWPRHANGNEVIWSEALPNWQPPAIPTDLDLLLEQEVPHYAYVQLMCAVVVDGKIHSLTTLRIGSPRTCE
jgi:hypothetical protein